MEEKITIVVHSEEAKKDIDAWLKKKGEKEKYQGEEMEVHLPGEIISIYKKDHLIDPEHCNKLVLFGSFSIEELIWITEVITIRPTPEEQQKKQQKKYNKIIERHYYNRDNF